MTTRPPNLLSSEQGKQSVIRHPLPLPNLSSMSVASWNLTPPLGCGYAVPPPRRADADSEERHSNRLKDYLTMAGPLGVTHLLLISRTELGTHLRIARTPRGPTLHFKIHSYSLAKDVKNHQKAPRESANDFLNPPLVTPSTPLKTKIPKSLNLKNKERKKTGGLFLW
jgi:Brix domain